MAVGEEQMRLSTNSNVVQDIDNVIRTSDKSSLYNDSSVTPEVCGDYAEIGEDIHSVNNKEDTDIDKVDNSPTLSEGGFEIDKQESYVELQGSIYSHCNFPCAHPAPNMEIKLFVGRIPRNIEEDELKKLFELYGNVVNISIVREKNTGIHRGAALVTMESIAQADYAIRELNLIKVLDNLRGPLKVQYSTGEAERFGFEAESCIPGVDQVKLFVGALPKNITEEEISDVFSPYGQINEIFIMREIHTGFCRGCAFVKYAFKEQGLYAIASLHGAATLGDVNRPLEVRFASRSSNANNLFLTHGLHHSAMAHNPPSGSAYHIFNNRKPCHIVNDASYLSANPTVVGNILSHRGSCSRNITLFDHNGISVAATTNMYPRSRGHPLSGSPSNSTAAAAITANLMPRCIGMWKEYFTSDGKPYYHNEISRVTQWEVPPEFMNFRPVFSRQVVGPPGANIFIFNVPYEWEKKSLIHHFCRFGHILSAHLMIDKNSGRNKGVAFVSYDHVHSAADAVNNMNGFVTESGRKLKVSIKQGQEQFVQHLISSKSY
ncbi:RNA recognition motif. family protein [Cryptosporidium muris RN66]|uniref:RNA recognition motif. family protein n=1 Tax=Cryptosporidium muris (strain RN66) TaxID=441375 RepID=B6AD95_CRYMR|nr:RNA recognition motif. family protein [Cryptosporidium muris RN66]EEA06099.1 RNA recognition motif. family protein [Cryptosporidium muris RN66]|eukprot:XP_002140448.1 RNA recognition motif. family protein [Cryptosporidium muris RN66]